MNRVWPARRRWYSSSTGSLTLSSRSASAHTSSAVGHDLRAGGHVVGVRDRGALAGAVLDQHRVPGADQLGHPGRGERDPVLTVLDLSGNPDAHDLRLLRLAGRSPRVTGLPRRVVGRPVGARLGRSLGTSRRPHPRLPPRNRRTGGPMGSSCRRPRRVARVGDRNCALDLRRHRPTGGCGDAPLRPAPRSSARRQVAADLGMLAWTCSGSWWRGPCTAPSSCSPNRGGRSRTWAARWPGNMGSAAEAAGGRAARRRRAGGAVRGALRRRRLGARRGPGRPGRRRHAGVRAGRRPGRPAGGLAPAALAAVAAALRAGGRRGAAAPDRHAGAGDPRRPGDGHRSPPPAGRPAGGHRRRLAEPASPTAVRALAALELRRLGLRLPGAATGSASSSLPS